MDFLSIRKKARERSEAKSAGTGGPAPAAPEVAKGAEPAAEPVPAPVQAPPEPARGAPPAPEAPPFGERRRGERRRTRGDEPVLTEQDLMEGALQARFQGLQPTPDGRFATWRPGAGPPPVEPDLEAGATPQAAPAPGAGSQAPEAAAPSARAPRPAAPARAEEADPLATFFYRPDEDAGSVPLLGGGPGEEPAAPAPDALDEFLTFTLGGEEYAVGIEHVREVLRAPAITEVPRAPAHVLGVVTVRGEVVAIVDARRRLGLPPGQGGGGGSRIVLVETGVGPLGLLVDAIANVVRLPRGSIEPCPQGIASAAADCVTGIGRWRERLFMVVDVGALLGRRAGEER
jgi:purine-binding chemotaxis protein CheW